MNDDPVTNQVLRKSIADREATIKKLEALVKSLKDTNAKLLSDSVRLSGVIEAAKDQGWAQARLGGSIELLKNGAQTKALRFHADRYTCECEDCIKCKR